MTNIYDLANDFNRFYHETKILAEEDQAKKESYLALLMLRLALFSKSLLISKRISMLKCKLVQCQQQKNKLLFKNWVKR